MRISPHQFRHLAGYLYLRQHPNGHEVVRALLGHHSIATTTQASTPAWRASPPPAPTTPWSWAIAMAGLEGGAVAALLPHRDPLRLGLPFGSWPRADRDAWDRALAAGDLLADGGRACHWAPASRRKVTGSYGCYLGWLARRGQLEPDRPVTARLNRDRVSAYLQERRDQVAYASLLGGLADLRMFARAAYPDEDWRWLAGLETALRQRGGPTRNKRSRLRGVAELVDLGERLMRPGGDAASSRGRKSQLAYRDGLMIAFLALRPLRLRNFTTLALGESLSARVPAGGSCWRPRRPRTGARSSCPSPTRWCPPSSTTWPGCAPGCWRPATREARPGEHCGFPCVVPR